jgi:peptidoglycan/xylan/chitin deacetylase (PgdA/CDA1 family)
MTLLGVIALLGWGSVFGAAAALARMYRQESRADRTIGLLYHRIVSRSRYDSFTGTEQIFSLPEDRFEAQLRWLSENGYTFVSLDQLGESLRDGPALPDRSVCITFDDGCESVYSHALPILQKLSVPAAVFVTIDSDAWIFHEGEYFERRMTPDEVKGCAEGGITVGSHAVTHRGLNEMSRGEVLDELVRARETLEGWTGHAVEHFAVPLNFYNRATLRLCQEAGYRTVCTSDNGTSNPDTDPYRIKRFIVEGSYDIDEFARSLQPRVILQRRILNSLKKLPPKILGERIWMPLREAIFKSPIGRWLTFRHLRLALLASVAGAGLLLVAITALALL